MKTGRANHQSSKQHSIALSPTRHFHQRSQRISLAVIAEPWNNKLLLVDVAAKDDAPIGNP